MSDFEANKQKYSGSFFKYTRQDICEVNNAASHLK